ncbi:MAG: glycyl radical protein, partial [Anaerolineae bacterium]|nr:glycyl radical protein [Anaerolineae bacterium]
MEELKLSSRVQGLLDNYYAARPEVFAERAVLVTGAYAQTEGQPITIRRAEAMWQILDGVTVLIRDGEPIVGCKTPAILGSPLYPEVASDWVEEEIDTIALRDEAPFYLSDETKETLRAEVFDYWRGRQVYNRIMEVLPSEIQQATDAGLFFHYYLNRTIGHITVDYERVLKKGFLGLKAGVEDELKKINYEDGGCLRKIHLLQAMSLCCEAAIRFAERYAEEAERLAAAESDPVRRAELEQSAEICRWVPAHPARTFHEALQSFWFVHLILNLETNSYAIGPGRFDQYMYPYYQADIDAGRLTQEQAGELLACLWIKFNELTVVKEGGTAKASTTYNDFQNLNLGGQTVEGQDATNELSYLCLDVTGRLKLPQPQIAALISEKTPDRFLMKACEVICLGFGLPAVFNDDEKVQALLHKGKTLEDARLGGINGCVELVVQGKDNMASSGYLSMPKCLELALNNGVDPLTGAQLGPSTGVPREFISFDQLMEAFRQQLAHAIELKTVYDGIARQAYAEFCPVPFTSLLISDCLEKGRDYHDGGARYNLPLICGVGTGTMADSLAAIKRLVYDEKRTSLEELVTALRADFAGYGRLRQMLLNRVPKWGNGDGYVDTIAHDVVEMFCDELEKHRNAEGVPYAANMIPTTTHIWFGSLNGATPDGRLAETPLSEGISPVQGTDSNGPTAVVRSMARLDHARCCGTLLNMKFHPTALSGEEGLRKFGHLIRTYFKLGGHHMQFNVVSAETLRAAQECPEEYRNLVVRVAGYSDYFVRLSRDLQDEIISRTEQGL